MVASVGRITAGSGYDYLTREVATSRHDYYAGRGEAPGVWAGRGAAGLGLVGVVDAGVMAALYGRFVDPRTVGGVRLADGRVQPERVLGRRVSVRFRRDGSVLEPVAAFDVTFSPAKSVSVLWATVTDAGVRQTVIDAHEVAVAAGLDYLEDHAGHVRAGVDGVRRVDGSGLIIAQFRHRTARSTAAGSNVGDPQLHSHCAILNRVHGVDGAWRTLDSKAIYRHTHAAGALHAATLEHELSARLGVGWVIPAGRVPMRELVGVPAQLVRLWSSRRRQLLDTFEQMLGVWQARTGRSPTRHETAGLLDRATLRSRRPKTRGDVDLHMVWRNQLTPTEQDTIDACARTDCTSDGGRMAAGSPELTSAVFASLHEQRSWWTTAHLFTEVARLIDEPCIARIDVEVERLRGWCVPLEADNDPDYTQADTTKYSSPTIIAAEQRVLASANRPAPWHVPTVDPATLAGLGPDQTVAVTAMSSGRSQLSTVIGPAGSGKTTMLTAVAAAYRAVGRPVIVLTLSAAAARVVTDETGLDASTIAAWTTGQIRFPHDGLVIIDEASMVPTLTLDRLVRVATAQRCRISFVGDYAQMGAPEAGGLLHDLATTPTATVMTSVRRFTHQWERDASKRLREHDPTVTADYLSHGRIIDVTTRTATETVAQAWLDDILAGADTIIVVDTATAAADINARCQTLLAANDRLGEHVTIGADDNIICVGDLIQTRHNTNTLPTSDRTRVLNRDTWQVTASTPDGTIIATHTRRPTTVTIPAEYTRQHVVLAYATTIAGAQGRTVDTAHTVITPRTVSAAVYVGMTRGRHTNHAYVITDTHDHDEFGLGNRTPTVAFTNAIIRNPDGQRSATSIRHDWQTGTSTRHQTRNNDRARLTASRWWAQHQQQLPARIRHALTDTHQAIIDNLTCRNPATWQTIVSTAIVNTDWDTPTAPAQLLHLLNHANPTIGTTAAGRDQVADTSQNAR